ncbi:uncharacterized protein CCOS01_08899 [Colletotrichum costaricense]|uniref:Uncharacterized protein n=2 Tax=Colletotrichum acutatum species complex TaxID=2707335 RepID=A0AAJ0DYN9_9PEZI|nr:uncharacterized protein CCOS01_08899 [Colletotrichum costaricense]XP_060377430.1 uncharacterized protein CTAM01_11877 [Colletotrichum tamarilloi]KAI3532931.1 hypothetical protein CSPX01_13136 [Colletotrichum filicis]KAK1487106.1 hypothetical protein CTAM01_11877 [Colletotrichum tamarilloi]KAK1523812.1 hypothetical protein CCOS01_08899 [Colletotrichum costaricense]
MTLDTVVARTYARGTPAPHRTGASCLDCSCDPLFFPIPTLMQPVESWRKSFFRLRWVV